MNIAKPSFAVTHKGFIMSDGWTTRASAVRVLQSQERYSRAIGQSTEGLAVIQGGYDSDSGDQLVRHVYPKRTAWRLV